MKCLGTATLKQQTVHQTSVTSQETSVSTPNISDDINQKKYFYTLKERIITTSISWGQFHEAAKNVLNAKIIVLVNYKKTKQT